MNNYPVGADNDPRAPWNEPLLVPMEFNVDIEYSLTRNVDVLSTDYENGEIDEDGNREYPEYLENDVRADYETEYLSPLEIINAYKEHCKTQLDIVTRILDTFGDDDGKMLRKKKHYQHIIKSCEGWTETFIQQ